MAERKMTKVAEVCAVLGFLLAFPAYLFQYGKQTGHLLERMNDDVTALGSHRATWIVIAWSGGAIALTALIFLVTAYSLDHVNEDIAVIICAIAAIVLGIPLLWVFLNSLNILVFLLSYIFTSAAVDGGAYKFGVELRGGYLRKSKRQSLEFETTSTGGAVYGRGSRGYGLRPDEDRPYGGAPRGYGPRE